MYEFRKCRGEGPHPFAGVGDAGALLQSVELHQESAEGGLYLQAARTAVRRLCTARIRQSRSTQGDQLSPRRIAKMHRSGVNDRRRRIGTPSKIVPYPAAPRARIERCVGERHENECGGPDVLDDVRRPGGDDQIIARIERMRSPAHREGVARGTIGTQHHASP